METFEALEARLAQEMSNIDCKSYGEEDDCTEYNSIMISPVKKENLGESSLPHIKKVQFEGSIKDNHIYESKLDEEIELTVAASVEENKTALTKEVENKVCDIQLLKEEDVLISSEINNINPIQIDILDSKNLTSYIVNKDCVSEEPVLQKHEINICNTQQGAIENNLLIATQNNADFKGFSKDENKFALCELSKLISANVEYLKHKDYSPEKSQSNLKIDEIKMGCNRDEKSPIFLEKRLSIPIQDFMQKNGKKPFKLLKVDTKAEDLVSFHDIVNDKVFINQNETEEKKYLHKNSDGNSLHLENEANILLFKEMTRGPGHNDLIRGLKLKTN